MNTVRYVLVVLLGLFTLLFSAAYYKKLTRTKCLRPIGLLKEAGWVDITLPIIQAECLSRSACTLRAIGLYEGKEAGVQIEINNLDPNLALQADPSTDDLKATKNGVVFIPLGQPTKELFVLLAKLYGYPIDQFVLPSQVGTTALALQGNTVDLKKNEAMIKLFRDVPAQHPEYFQLFIDIDLPNKLIQLREKDPAYRIGILRSFGAKIK